MKFFQKSKTDFSLIFACLLALAAIIVSEMAFHASAQALADVRQERTMRIALNAVQKNMLDVETGQRGFLLTGDSRYLEPYDAALKEVNKNLETLRESLADLPDQMQAYYQLNTALAKKLAECAITIELRRSGSDTSWKDILLTDLGKNDVDAARSHIQSLVAASSVRLQNYDKVVVQTAAIARRGIALLVALGLGAFFLYLKTIQRLRRSETAQQTALAHERDRLETLVVQRTESLNDLATHLQDVRENERSHLARELHDELGALLTAAKLNVMRVKSRLDPGAVDLQQLIVELTQLLNEGIALKRRVIEDLRPSSLGNLGLAPSLEILGREFSQRAGVSVTTNLEPVTLDETAQLTVYRLVQEALTNVGKYAQAAHVDISLRALVDHVTIAVTDDGVGFDQADIAHNAHGLQGMRHRVQAAGGQLSVSSTPGHGTSVSAAIPLQAPVRAKSQGLASSAVKVQPRPLPSGAGKLAVVAPE